MASPERVQLLILRGTIAELTAEDRCRVEEAYAELKAVLEKHGDDAGTIALGLLGAEKACE